MSDMGPDEDTNDHEEVAAMSEPLTKYWAWDYEMRQLGSFALVNYTGHNKAVEVYLAADVDALLDDPQALAAYLVERQKGQP